MNDECRMTNDEGSGEDGMRAVAGGLARKGARSRFGGRRKLSAIRTLKSIAESFL